MAAVSDPQGEMESKDQPDHGEEFLPTSGRHRVSLLWHHWRYLVQPRRRWSQLPSSPHSAIRAQNKLAGQVSGQN